MLAYKRSIDKWQAIPLVDGELQYWPRFLSSYEANRYFESLREKITWHVPRVKIYGKELESPRMAAWYGDADAVYTYSGLTNQPLPWFKELSGIRHRIEQQTQNRFNSVLANLYRDGNDSMGWHSDSEPELGLNPVIASLSLGAERRFVLRHKKRKAEKPVEIRMQNGSLLLMTGDTQHYWRHCVPKTRKPVASRLNLTFRQIEKVQPLNGC